jgi:hypothetical protein
MTIYSFRLPLNLWYEPKAIAATALVMGYQTSGINLPTGTNASWSQYLEDNGELIGGTYHIAFYI